MVRDDVREDNAEDSESVSEEVRKCDMVVCGAIIILSLCRAGKDVVFV